MATSLTFLSYETLEGIPIETTQTQLLYSRYESRKRKLQTLASGCWRFT